VDAWPAEAAARVIDTPGIREFGLWRLGRDELRACFPEFEQASIACRFGDCKHLVEPDCGVRSVVRDGSVAARRYESYRRLAGSLSA
jgi:ribosome biogenesis GTPase